MIFVIVGVGKNRREEEEEEVVVCGGEEQEGKGEEGKVAGERGVSVFIPSIPPFISPKFYTSTVEGEVANIQLLKNESFFILFLLDLKPK